MKKYVLAGAIAAAVVSQASVAQGGRDYISIVGSSTVYPFATVVAERFGKSTSFKTPKRRIKKSEVARCAENGVKDIVEVKVGYDGIVFGSSKKATPISLTRKQLWMALAKDVPDPAGSGKLVPNPYATWKQIDPSLPPRAIEVIGPPPTSGTRDAFVELLMEEGCDAFEMVKAMKKTDKAMHRAVCQSIREDGAFVASSASASWIRTQTRSTTTSSTAYTPRSTTSPTAATPSHAPCTST